jgi:hypothetical protein
MTTSENHATACAVEGLVNAHRRAGLDDRDLGLALLAAGADLLLTRAWDAPRVLAAFDVLVDAAAHAQSEHPVH